MADHCNWLILFIWQAINLMDTNYPKIDLWFIMSLIFQHISTNKLESLIKSMLITFANDSKLKHGTSTSHYREL